MSSNGTFDRKRPRDDSDESVNGEETTVDGALALEVVTTQDDLLAVTPPPKKAKAGRPRIVDEPCEHGPSKKACQKCIYRKRAERAATRFDDRGVITKLIFLWSQNLVFFSSLASSVVLSDLGSLKIEEISKLIDARVVQFRHYLQAEITQLADVRASRIDEAIAFAFDSMNVASPASVETVYMAKWLIDRHRAREGREEILAEDGGVLAPLIGKACASFTDKIAMLWEDNMICPGITDADLVEHFKQWRGKIWRNRDGVFGVISSNNEEARSIHCTGFSSDGLCDRCNQLKLLVTNEKIAFDADPPGYQMLLKSLPPRFADICSSLKVRPADDSPLMGALGDMDYSEILVTTMEILDLPEPVVHQNM